VAEQAPELGLVVVNLLLGFDARDLEFRHPVDFVGVEWFGFRLRFQAANRRNFDSATPVVAGLARPLAQLLNPDICSAIGFDSGTKSVKTRAVDKSFGSLPASNAWNSDSTNTASISEPVIH
jgi:hypothetical protein